MAARRGIPHHRHHHRAGESGRESGPWCVRPNNSPALGLEQNTPFFFSLVVCSKKDEEDGAVERISRRVRGCAGLPSALEKAAVCSIEFANMY